MNRSTMKSSRVVRTVPQIALTCLAALCLLASIASAEKATGTLRGRVVVADGDNPSMAVAYLRGATLRATIPSTPPSIRQVGKKFDPGVLAIVKGTTVAFPNDDRIMHNVFSRSAGNSFDLGYYKSGDSKMVVFKSLGIVDVYCNIHPHMVATILVLENDFFARVGSDGRFEISDVPAGQHDLIGWMPGAESAPSTITVKAGGVTEIEIKMPKAQGHGQHMNKENMPYGRYK